MHLCGVAANLAWLQLASAPAQKKIVHEDQRVIAQRAGLTHLGLSFSLHQVRI
jgi:hypothetical protein